MFDISQSSSIKPDNNHNWSADVYAYMCADVHKDVMETWLEMCETNGPQKLHQMRNVSECLSSLYRLAFPVPFLLTPFAHTTNSVLYEAVSKFRTKPYKIMQKYV